LRQRVAGEIDCDAAERRLVELEFMAEAFADLFEHANAFSDDFGTDAIARDDGNVCLHRWFCS
jgi:hypothetical protein